MAAQKIVEPELLRQLLSYDSETGVLRWRNRGAALFSSNRFRTAESYCAAWNRKFEGAVAFATTLNTGYLTGSIFGTTYSAHRVAWAIYHGEWPVMIDHVNGIRTDNRICNLRTVTNSANQRNAARQSNNKSGVNGVFWSARLRKWRACIQIDGRYKELGRFANLQDAAEARQQAEEMAGGFTRRHGT